MPRRGAVLEEVRYKKIKDVYVGLRMCTIRWELCSCLSAVLSAWRHLVAAIDSAGLHCEGINTRREKIPLWSFAPNFAEPSHVSCHV